MLSLVVVLSVYYVTTPDKMNTASPATGEKIGQEKQGTDKAVTNEAPKETPKKKIQARKQQIKKQTKRKCKKETSKKEGNVSVQSSDENFTALRMQMEDQRSEQKAKLQEVMSSTKASATEKNKAKRKF